MAATGQPATLTDYDELNLPIMTGLDVDGNGRLEPASADRIEAYRTGSVKSDGAWWQQEQQLAYPETGSDNPTVVSTSLTRLIGWDGSLVVERIVIDSHGAKTVARETVDRGRRVIHPDSTIPAEQHVVNGLLVAATSTTGRTTTYRSAIQFSYDRLGRKKTVTDVLGTRSYEYDDRLQLIGEQQHGLVPATIKRRNQGAETGAEAGFIS